MCFIPNNLYPLYRAYGLLCISNPCDEYVISNPWLAQVVEVISCSGKRRVYTTSDARGQDLIKYAIELDIREFWFHHSGWYIPVEQDVYECLKWLISISFYYLSLLIFWFLDSNSIIKIKYFEHIWSRNVTYMPQLTANSSTNTLNVMESLYYR